MGVAARPAWHLKGERKALPLFARQPLPASLEARSKGAFSRRAIHISCFTWQAAFIDVCEWVFLAIFTFELLAKVLAYGFLMHKGAYLRDSWCQLDFVVVTLAWIPILFPGFGNFSSLRAFRALRPLRALKRGACTRAPRGRTAIAATPAPRT